MRWEFIFLSCNHPTESKPKAIGQLCYSSCESKGGSPVVSIFPAAGWGGGEEEEGSYLSEDIPRVCSHQFYPHKYTGQN